MLQRMRSDASHRERTRELRGDVTIVTVNTFEDQHKNRNQCHDHPGTVQEFSRADDEQDDQGCQCTKRVKANRFFPTGFTIA